MKRCSDIMQKIIGKRNIFVLFGIILLLCGCGECETIQDYWGGGIGGSCLICSIFNMVADAAVKAANKSWRNLAEPLRIIIVLITAVYIALYTLKHVSSFGKQNVADYMTGDKKGILVLIFKTAVIFGVLDGYGDRQWFINHIMTPILEAGIEIGNQVSALSISSDIFSSSGSGWNGTFELLKKEVKAFNDNIYLMVALGQAMICNATPLNAVGALGWYHLMLFYGFIYFIFGWMLLAAAGLFMIDVGITLSIAAILLPFGIACTISEWSVSYAKNLWNMFLTVFFSFIVLGIIVGLSLSMVFHCIGNMNLAGMAFAVEGFDMDEIEKASDIPNITVESFNLIEALDANNVKTISEFLWSSGNLLLTILCFMLIVQLFDQMKELAQKLSDGTGFSPASQVGGDLTKPVARAGHHVVSWGKDAAISHVSKSLSKNKFIDRIQKGYTTFRGRAFGIGSEGYKAWWRR